MEKLKAYRITRGNSEGTLQEGDTIWLSESGDIHCVQADGCIFEKEQNKDTMDFEYEEDPEYNVIILGKSVSCRKIGFRMSESVKKGK